MEQVEVRRVSARKQALVYLVALAVYTALVYGPFLWAGPVPEGLERVAGVPQRLIDEAPRWVPRLNSILLLYIASASVFFLTTQLVDRPMWLASFAAVLFMANPVKGEVMYALGGPDYMRPAAMELLGLATYAYARKHSRDTALQLAAFAIFCRILLEPIRGDWDVITGEMFLAHLWPLALVHLLVPEAREGRGVTLGKGMLVAVAIAVVLGIMPINWAFPTPILLSLYPIGLLPETQALLTLWPWLELGLCCLAGVAFVLIYRKSRHPALLFGGAGAVGYWWLMGPREVDMVTLQGGDALLVPAALVSVGLAGLVHSILRHPKWFRPMVLLTALWCVVYFVLQVRAGMAWTPSE